MGAVPKRARTAPITDPSFGSGAGPTLSLAALADLLRALATELEEMPEQDRILAHVLELMVVEYLRGRRRD